MKKKNLIKLQDITFGTIAVSSLFLLLGANGAFATTSVVDDVTVTVPAACTMSTTVNSNHTATVEVGSYVEDIGETTFKVICNDSEGFSVYAVGYSGDAFGNTTMKPSVVADTNAIATGLATSGSTSNWAMKLTAVTGDYAPTLETGFNAYHVIPAEYTKVASYSANTDSSSGSSFKSTYAAFVASAQPADTYTGKVKYTVIHPANADAPGMEISDLTYMQDFNNLTAAQRASVLNSMKYNTAYNLVDNRDNKTYQVARLKDDNIWMAENLDLGRIQLTEDLNNQNTNLESSDTIAASTFNAWIKTSSTGALTTAELIPLTVANSSDQLDVDSRSNTPYGTLYNFCAASAGVICSDTGSNRDNALSDICPAGWRLPTGGSSGEFKSLYNLTDYNTTTKMRAPITNGGAAFALAGYFESSTPISQGSYGDYWASTRSNGSNMHRLWLDPYTIYVDSSAWRSNGLSVRCIARKPHYLTVSYDAGVSSIQVNGVIARDGEVIRLEEGFSYSITMTPNAEYRFTSWSVGSGTINSVNSQSTTYIVGNSDTTLVANTSYITTEMQNLTSNNCTTIASFAKDNRDGRVYAIQRLADGKCWMMENLDLGRTELTTDLTSSNTNLTDTVAASTFNGWKKTAGTENSTAGEFILIDGVDSNSDTLYGTLYNYCAVSAGTICTRSYDRNATKDICPAGWRLPTGDTPGEFQALYNLTDYNTSAKMRASIVNGGAAFARAGSFYYSPSGQGSSGNYWSSTRYSSTAMYYLKFNSSSVYPADSASRVLGHSVRCILKN